jgi:hypothetical protein
MDEDIIEQVEPHIREILRICRGRELHELNALVGRTSKLTFLNLYQYAEEAGAVQNRFAELNGEADTHCPITFAFHRLRRSDRLSGDKRTYEAMQGANKRTGKLPKRLKLVPDEAGAAEASTNENSDNDTVHKRSVVDKTSSYEPVEDDLTTEPATLESTSDPTATKPNIMEPQEVLSENTPREQEIPYPEPAIDSVEACGSISHSGLSESVSWSINPTRGPSYETNATDIDSMDVDIHPPFAKRAVLDDGPQLLEHVLVALDGAYDDRRAPTSCIPGVLDEVRTTSDHAIFVKIMTSITENWAKCNRLIAWPALEVAQERLAKIEQGGISLTRGGRCQAGINRGDRTESDHLRHTIACHDRRELSEIELRDILSEPLELMGEFNDENDYENVLKRIEKENANDTKARLRRMWKETYYWPMVQQRAKMDGPLPNASGPRTEITPEEKSTPKKLVAAMGYGQSRSNIFKWTS